MKKGLLLVVLTLYFVDANVKKSMITNVYFNVSCNQQYLTVAVDVNKTKNDYMFNVTFEIKVPIDSIILIPRFSMPKYEGDKDYTVEFTPVAVNICNFKNVFRTRALLRLLLETFLNQLEEKFVCPLKKGYLRMINCKLSNIDVPKVIPETKFKISGYMMGRVPKQKKLIQLCSVDIFAEYKRPKGV